jgi:GDP-L-fucose synthase
MNIFVTGATGFLGKVLCPYLRELGHQVTAPTSKQCDLQKQDTLEPFNAEKFDCIYHLAVWTQAGDFCLKHPAEQWMVNQKINTHMLDWWQRKQPQAKLISIGTSCAYDPSYPLEEQYYLSGKPIDSLVAFGMSKRMLLCGLQSMHQQYGLDYLFPIPATLYGIEGYHEDGKRLHFIFDLARKILRGKLHRDKVVLWGDGTQKRELLYAKDFAKAIVRLADTHSNEAINVGAEKEYSIREFAEILCKQVDYPFEKIEWDTSRYVGARSKVISTAKLKKALPAFSPTSLSEGLGEMIDQLRPFM